MTSENIYAEGAACNLYRKALFDMALIHGGAMINTGDHLGVMVGPSGSHCPPGWVFLDIEQCRSPNGLELFSDSLDWAATGRQHWPGQSQD